MPTFRFAKLVRDKIVRQMQSNGQEPVYRVLGWLEYLRELGRKLMEEATELPVDDAASIDTAALLDELADVQEVVDCFLAAIGRTKEELAAAQVAKKTKAGSFTARLYVETVRSPEASSWTQYYRAQPDRYPEVA